MSELLPCPFCGGEAETLTAESMHGGYLFGIMCSDCRSRGDVYTTEDEAIAAWNSRAERMCHNISTTSSFRCSECDATDLDFDKPSYCHGCGAKVVGE